MLLSPTGSYAPIGKTPLVKQRGKKEKVNMISGITNKGKIHWKLYKGNINSERFLEFVQHLIKYKRKKVFLIVDNS